MGSDSLFVKCKTCGKDIAKSARTCPQCGGKQKNISVLQWIGIVFGALIVIGLFGSPGSSDCPESCNNNGSVTTPGATSAAPAATSTNPAATSTNPADKKSAHKLDSLQPSDQSKFIEIVSSTVKKFKGTKNELQQSILKGERKDLLEKSQIGDSVSGWLGTIKNLGTNNDGKAYLSIRISPDIDIKTWNNAFSDISYSTLIEKESDLYKRLSELSVGQRVKFSGSFFPSEEDFFEETSMTVSGSMNNPEFLFKFKSVEVVN